MSRSGLWVPPTAAPPLPPRPPRRRPVGAVVAVVVGLLALVGAVRALDADVLAGDVPAGDWADDWEAVTAAVVAYADALDAQGGGAFDMPASEDGFTVTFRMDSAVPGCVLPPVVERLDPDPPRSVAEAELVNRS